MKYSLVLVIDDVYLISVVIAFAIHRLSGGASRLICGNTRLLCGVGHSRINMGHLFP